MRVPRTEARFTRILVAMGMCVDANVVLSRWLSCIDQINTRRRERWCAIHENKLYEFEAVLGELMVNLRAFSLSLPLCRKSRTVTDDLTLHKQQLKVTHNLEGCICYASGDSSDTFVLRTAGLFRFSFLLLMCELASLS